jgi:dynein heavy chain 2
LFAQDHQLTTDAILEVINSLLSSGEVPGLYTHEELEPLLGPLKEKAMEDASGRFKNAYEYFVHQVSVGRRAVLHDVNQHLAGINLALAPLHYFCQL